MSKLDALKQQKFVIENLEGVSYDVEKLQWNRDLLRSHSRSKAGKKSLLNFPQWLIEVEHQSIDELTNDELTILFDKYTLFMYVKRQSSTSVVYSGVSVIEDALLKQRNLYTAVNTEEEPTVIVTKNYDTTNVMMTITDSILSADLKRDIIEAAEYVKSLT